MRLSGLSWPQAGGTALAVPLGATEQHGPHLPLDTDTRIASAVAGELPARVPGVTVAPALPYGASGEHESFPGTVSIGRQALELMLTELVRSATRSFSPVVFVNGHGGNAEAIAAAVRQLRAEGRDVRAWHAVTGGDAHAGRSETSLMLALAPELVRLDRAEAGNTTPLPELIDTIRAESVRAVSPNGVLGNPAGASAAAGRELFDQLADDLARAVTA